MLRSKLGSVCRLHPFGRRLGRAPQVPQQRAAARAHRNRNRDVPVCQLHLRRLMMDRARPPSGRGCRRTIPLPSPVRSTAPSAARCGGLSSASTPASSAALIGSAATSVLLPRASISLAFNIFLHLPGTAAYRRSPACARMIVSYATHPTGNHAFARRSFKDLSRAAGSQRHLLRCQRRGQPLLRRVAAHGGRRSRGRLPRPSPAKHSTSFRSPWPMATRR